MVMKVTHMELVEVRYLMKIPKCFPVLTFNGRFETVEAAIVLEIDEATVVIDKTEIVMV